MAVPTWVPGQTLDSSDLNVWCRSLGGYKIGTTSQASNTILAADPDLKVVFTTYPGLWVIELLLRYNGPAANGLTFSFTVPAGATGTYGVQFMNTTGGSGTLDLRQHPFSFAGMQLKTTGTGNELTARLTGLITSSPGTLQFNWAQLSSNATATSIDAGSYLCAWRAG